MNLTDLGYTDKWIRYGILNDEVLNNQITDFKNGDDLNTEHYRYVTLLNWVKCKLHFTNSEIENLLELSYQDSDLAMTGSVLKDLFTSSKITETQFNLIRNELPKFGDWTTKLITRECLKRRILNNDIDEQVVLESISFTNQFNENILLELLIDKSISSEILLEFTKSSYSKKVRNLAKDKLRRLKNAGNKG